MKRILLTLLLLCSNVFAQDMYNSIATAYVTTTISQNVVFNSTMQQGGTFTFSVLAHNGGGRAGQSDTANVKIQFYTSGGTLVSQVQTNYSANLPNPNAVCGNPCIDPAVPWTTISVSSTLTAAQASTVAYAKISMYGIDGSYWAGDYGPWYRAPTFQLDGGANLAYNPEFGPYNGITAQGWTSSPGFGACQGAWGGSNACIVNSSGTPGTSTTGLVANQNGGGPDPNGGTTSGTAGGYNSTMTTSSPTGAPATPTTNWQAISTASNPVVISNIYPTSYNSPGGEGAANAFDGNTNTKYLNFDKKNAGVTVRLSQGRVVQKFTLTTANDYSGRDPTSYKLYGSNDGVNWTLIKADTVSLSETRNWTSPEITVNNTTAYVYYFMLFPTTKAGDAPAGCTGICAENYNSMQISEITYYYDANDGVTSSDQAAGSTPANPGQPGSVCADCYSSDITPAQLIQLNDAKSRLNAVGLGNRIDLYSEGSGNQVTIEQVGSWNKIQGLGGGNARVAGFGTAVDIKQGDYTSGKNLIELYSQGNGNNITISQARNTTTGAQDGQESGGHFLQLKVVGDINTVTMRQGNDGGYASGHFAFLDVAGNFNNITIKQANDNEKRFFGTVTGSSNSLNVTQQNTGNHYLDISLNGNNNSATVNQKDGGSHKATISLTNAGGASNLTLIQQGATGQVYSIQQTCANAAGCTVSVQQQ
jgi:hypothetical protein